MLWGASWGVKMVKSTGLGFSQSLPGGSVWGRQESGLGSCEEGTEDQQRGHLGPGTPPVWPCPCRQSPILLNLPDAQDSSKGLSLRAVGMGERAGRGG